MLEHVGRSVPALREHDQKHVTHRPRVLAAVRRALPEHHFGGGVSKRSSSLPLLPGRWGAIDKFHPVFWAFYDIIRRPTKDRSTKRKQNKKCDSECAVSGRLGRDGIANGWANVM